MSRADSVSAALGQLGLTWRRPEYEVLAAMSPATIPTGASSGRPDPIVLRPAAAVNTTIPLILTNDDMQSSSRIRSVLQRWPAGRNARSAAAFAAEGVKDIADQAFIPAEFANG